MKMSNNGFFNVSSLCKNRSAVGKKREMLHRHAKNVLYIYDIPKNIYMFGTIVLLDVNPTLKIKTMSVLHCILLL